MHYEMTIKWGGFDIMELRQDDEAGDFHKNEYQRLNIGKQAMIIRNTNTKYETVLQT